MKVVTAHEMQTIDARTIREYGLPEIVLMERAGLCVSNRIKDLYAGKGIVVVCGSGNNGGDGLVAARQLHNDGRDVRVFLASKKQILSDAAMLQHRMAERFGVRMHSVADLVSLGRSSFGGHTVIIDALFGTGLSKPVTGVLADVVGLMNESGLPILSVDIPSGINSDNGQVEGIAVKAACTVTFGLPKRGHLLHPGAAHTGKLYIEDIGFPRSLITSTDIPVEYLEGGYVSSLIPARNVYSHKGNYGHILLIAGSRGKTGAAKMAARGCLRSGAGLLTVGVPASLSGIFQACFSEEMTLVLPDKRNGELSSKSIRLILDFIGKTAHVVAIGPGLGVSNDTIEILRNILLNTSRPVVIDADGLRALRGDKKLLRRAKAPIVLTPHPGEMKSLLQRAGDAPDIEKDRITVALKFAAESGAYVVLKGVPTVIAAPDGRCFVNSTGNPGMATAGAGDVLTGMIAGLLGQIGDPLHACLLGVYLHGLAGDIAASMCGEHSLVASDIIENIPNAFGSLKSRD